MQSARTVPQDRGKPIVGDRVTLEIQPEDGTGYLQTIAPRKTA